MDRQPHGLFVRIGRRNAVLLMGWQIDEVAWQENPGLIFSLNLECRASLKQDNEFAERLVVPIPRRRSMPLGDDAFDANPVPFNERLKQLLRQLLGKIAKQVGYVHG